MPSAQAAGEVVVAADAEHPLFNDKNDTGEIGYDVDITMAICREAGLMRSGYR